MLGDNRPAALAAAAALLACVQYSMMDDGMYNGRSSRAFVGMSVHISVDPPCLALFLDGVHAFARSRLKSKRVSIGWISLDSRQRLPNKQATNDDDDQDDSSTQVTTHHHAVALVVPRYDDDDHDERLCGGPTDQNVLLVVAQHTQ